MIIYLADRRMNIINMVTSELTKNGMVIVSDKKTEEIEYGSNILELVISYTGASREEANESTKVGNYILVQYGEESGYYTIIQKEDDTSTNEISIYAEDAGLDLLNEVLEPYTADKEYDIAFYINTFIYDSGFEIHVNELSGITKRLAWSGEDTATSRVLSVASAFEAEISYSFIIENMSVTHKYINIYKRRGEDTSVELRLDREINSIITKHTIENLATAFMNVKGATPEGTQNPITLSGYSYDDGDIYTSGNWMYSRKGLEKWSRYLSETGHDVGHVVRTFTYNTTSQAELCEKAVEELKKISDIEVNYEVDIADLPDTLSIGDMLNIVDNDGGLYISARILKLETSYVNNTAVATLGDYLIKEGGISQKLEDLSAEFKEIAKNRVFYTWIAYADDENGNGISLNPSGKNFMGTAVNRLSEEPLIDDANIYSWVKVKGENGESVFIRSVSVTYQISNSGTTIPAGLWIENPPAIDSGKYLWTRTVVMYSDGKSTTSYSISHGGNDGADGNSGIIVSEAAPENPAVGQLWQTDSGKPIKRWNGKSWVIHYISIDNLRVDKLSAIAADLGIITAGSININDKFIVNQTGEMKTTRGKIAGWDISDNAISHTIDNSTMSIDSDNNVIRSTLLKNEGEYSFLDVVELGLAVLNMYRTITDENGSRTQTTKVGIGCIEMNDDTDNYRSVIRPYEIVISSYIDHSKKLSIASNSIVATSMAGENVGSIFFDTDYKTNEKYINFQSDSIRCNGKEIRNSGLYMVSGTIVLGANSDSVKVHTWSQIQELFNIKYGFVPDDYTKLGISFINGDGGATSAHIEGGTWLASELYAVFNSKVSGQIRINYAYFYVY